MAVRHEIVPVQLANGAKMHVEATVLGGDADIAIQLLSFQAVTDTIEGIAGAMNTAMHKIKPRKAGVEFGLELAVESGQLTALLVKDAGTANLKISLEWDE